MSVIPFAVFLSTVNLFCLLIPWRIASSIGAFSVGVISFLPLTYFASCGSYLNGNALSIAFDTETRALLNVVTDRISIDFFAIGIFLSLFHSCQFGLNPLQPTASHGFMQCMQWFCLRCVGCQ